jgi:hypothetical protein
MTDPMTDVDLSELSYLPKAAVPAAYRYIVVMTAALDLPWAVAAWHSQSRADSGRLEADAAPTYRVIEEFVYHLDAERRADALNAGAG